MIAQRNTGARALVIISTIVAVLVLLLATAVHAFAGSDSLGVDTAEYLVRAGDSLWSIAVDVGADGDPRPVISEIVELNDLADVSIHPGQVLLIPTDR
jgi:nucleoid-associated protein YgaU